MKGKMKKEKRLTNLNTLDIINIYIVIKIYIENLSMFKVLINLLSYHVIFVIYFPKYCSYPF